MYIPEIPECSIKPLLEEITYIAEKTQNIAWHYSSFNQPATEAEISLSESEINLKIPTEYRDLLKFSNGFEFFGVSSHFFGTSDIKNYHVHKPAWFPSDYVIFGLLVGDGEMLCYSKETGKFLKWFNGEERWFDTFYDVLNNIVSHIREQAEEYME